MASKIDIAIAEVEALWDSYATPSSYQEPEWYARCDAKYDAFSDVLHILRRLKNEEENDYS